MDADPGLASGGLVLTLDLALFVLVGLLSMVQTYWFPWDLRPVHSLEILADSVVYAWVLGVLLVRGRGAAVGEGVAGSHVGSSAH
jgi:hypothetical protein